MAIVGVGIDVVSIPDFAAQVDQPGTVFAETFTPGERRDAGSHRADDVDAVLAPGGLVRQENAVVRDERLAVVASDRERRERGHVGRDHALNGRVHRVRLRVSIASDGSDLLDHVGSAGVGPNVATFAGFGAIRQKVLKDEGLA